MKDLVWELFKKTGNIKYFLLVKKLEGDLDGVKEVRINNNK